MHEKYHCFTLFFCNFVEYTLEMIAFLFETAKALMKKQKIFSCFLFNFIMSLHSCVVAKRGMLQLDLSWSFLINWNGESFSPSNFWKSGFRHLHKNELLACISFNPPVINHSKITNYRRPMNAPLLKISYCSSKTFVSYQ
jgi:hypothetical protein